MRPGEPILVAVLGEIFERASGVEVIGCALAPYSEIKYFLACIRIATLARNAPELPRQLSITQSIRWRDDRFRFYHEGSPAARTCPTKHVTLLGVGRFRERSLDTASAVFWPELISQATANRPWPGRPGPTTRPSSGVMREWRSRAALPGVTALNYGH
jgi:hypothetical protein